MPRMMGADNPAYRGGVTHLRALIRNSKAYKGWKELVYQRDRYRCQKCNVLGTHKTLECHHIGKEFAELLQDFILLYSKYSLPKDEQRLLELSQCYAPLWRISQGQTLCRECHREHHRLEKLSEKTKE